MSNSSIERRVHERFNHVFEMEGVVEREGVVARMVARNLSLGGVYCTSTIDFPEMTRLGVRMMLPPIDEDRQEPAPVDVEAVVVRRKEIPSPAGNGNRYQLALFFTRIDSEQKRLLSSYIEPAV